MKQIQKHIEEWLTDIRNNGLEPGSKKYCFATPLIGSSSGNDKIFTFLKGDIGPEFYWTPLEAFAHAFPHEQITPDELTVIAWILPQTKETRKEHRKATELPSIEWSKARHYGEKVNENLRMHMVEYFQLKGFKALAPVLLKQWNRHNSDKYGFASSWSERHAAHVCGLGTFSLSDGLITAAGKAVRIGSIIVNAQLQPTERNFSSHTEWCLFYSTGKCMACARRCPANAITKNGHDKVKCKKYIREVTATYVEKEQLGYKVNSCGLCQTKVPCEARNPTSWEKRS